MKKVKNDLLALSTMISIMILIIFYKLLNNGNGNIYSLITSLDKTIPFLKIFILPYITWYGYVAIGLIYLCMKNRKTYFTALISLNIGIVVCYIIYALFQTTVPRPVVNDTDVLSVLVNIIYKYDNPFNCFPSMHVTTTYIILKGIKHTENKITTRFAFKIIGVLIIISTLFVKQHVILDLAIGMLLGEVIFRLINDVRKENISIMINKLSPIWIIKRKIKNPT